MRFLGVGETNDLGDMYLRLMKAGHEVRVHMADPDSAGVMEGMLEFTDDWRAELDWVRETNDEGFILFETASAGEDQDELRRSGFNVIGGSALGDRLETDRGYGQQVLRDIGLATAATRVLSSFGEAIAFAQKRPRRYVMKLDGSNWPSTSTYAGQTEDGADVIALLTAMKRAWSLEEIPRVVLMDHVSGVEVGLGAFFNGTQFLGPPNLDWEYKRFFPGDIGEMTGEMGTVVTYRDGERLFDATLARMAPMLAESGYCGYINLNTIVNEDGVWPLEFTSRFGYPGFPILSALHDEGWDTIFAAMAHGSRNTIRTKDGIATGVVLTVPPFPYRDGYAELGKGIPICLQEPLTEQERDAMHYGEVTMVNGQLVTAGMIGYIMVVTGVGETIESSTREAYERVRKVVIPNMRYRNDIGARFNDDCAKLKRLGWLQ